MEAALEELADWRGVLLAARRRRAEAATLDAKRVAELDELEAAQHVARLERRVGYTLAEALTHARRSDEAAGLVADALNRFPLVDEEARGRAADAERDLAWLWRLVRRLTDENFELARTVARLERRVEHLELDHGRDHGQGAGVPERDERAPRAG